MANFISFLAELFFKLLIPFGAFMAGREAEKKDATLEAVKEMGRDAKISAEPAKRGRNLIDSL